MCIYSGKVTESLKQVSSSSILHLCSLMVLLFWGCSLIKVHQLMSCTLVAKSKWTSQHYTHMWLLNIASYNYVGINHQIIKLGCRDLFPLRRKSINEVCHGCAAITSGSQSAFLLILKVLDGAEVKALSRPFKFFHTTLGNPFLYRPGFVHGVVVVLKLERDKHKWLSHRAKVPTVCEHECPLTFGQIIYHFT